MAWQNIVVAWAPDAAPLEAIVDWEDITEYVETISINRGRSDELSQFSAGTCSLVLRNDDRRFDPNYSAGPYFGNLKPKRTFYVSADDGTEHFLFYGYSAGFPQEIDYEGNRSYVSIDLVDAFEAFGSETIAENYWVHNTQQDDNVLAWFRFKDQKNYVDGVTYMVDMLDGTNGGKYIPRSTAPQWSEGMVRGSSSFAGDDSHYILTDDFAWFGEDGQTGWTLEFFIKVDVTPPTPSSSNIMSNASFGGASVGVIAADQLPSSFFPLSNPGGLLVNIDLIDPSGPTRSSATIWSERIVNDGIWHHVVVTIDTVAKYAQLYIDGQPDRRVEALGIGSWPSTYELDRTFEAFASVSGFPDPPRTMTIGASLSPQGSAILGEGIYVGEIVTYNEARSDSWAADRYDQVLGYPGERTGTKLLRLLSLFGWSPFGASVQPGDSVSGPDVSGSFLDAMQLVAESEIGLFYMSGGGVATFLNRNFYVTQTRSSTVQAEFKDIAGELQYVEAVVSQDDRYIKNIGEASRIDGPIFVYVNESSKDEYFGRVSSKTGLDLANDHEARSYAYWLAHRQAEPQNRVTVLRLDARTSSAVASQCMTREIGDRVSVERLPQGVGSAWVCEGIIDSITHEISLRDRRWTTEFKLAPIDNEDFLILDSASDDLDSPLGF